MNKQQNFVAQQSGPSTIKVFNAVTGQLYKIINVGNIIATPPICTQTELSVGVYVSGKVQALKVYSIPRFNLKKTVTL